jgi:hypothetical protein
MSDEGTTRREVLRKAAYATPLLVTLKANLELASAGSGLPTSTDRVITGGSEPMNAGNSTPGGSASPSQNYPSPTGTQPPALDTSGPGSSRPPVPNTLGTGSAQAPIRSIPTPVNSELLPPDDPVVDNYSPPQNDNEITGKRRRRWQEWILQWLQQLSQR